MTITTHSARLGKRVMWQAYTDDPDGPIGDGATEQEAIDDLKRQMEKSDDQQR